MLGFVNGRSCAHKSKPRGLILCFYDFGCKGSTNFLQKRVVFILLFVNFCYRAYKKTSPREGWRLGLFYVKGGDL